MYLNNGREIYECDQYPGYYIDANTGAFCDEDGHYVGGNIDEGLYLLLLASSRGKGMVAVLFLSG